MDCSLSLRWVMEFHQQPFAAMITPKPTLSPTAVVQPALPYWPLLCISMIFQSGFPHSQQEEAISLLLATSMRITSFDDYSNYQDAIQSVDWIGIRRCGTDPALFRYFDSEQTLAKPSGTSLCRAFTYCYVYVLVLPLQCTPYAACSLYNNSLSCNLYCMISD